MQVTDVGVFLSKSRKELDELATPFPLVDSSRIEEESVGHALLPSERIGIGRIEKIHPHADGLPHLAVNIEALEHQELLGLGIEDEGTRVLEDLLVDPELQGRLVVHGGS